MTRTRGELEAGGAVCAVCGGRGWVVEVGCGAGRARPCGCSTARPIAERLASAGVWEAYRHCTRESWQGAWPEAQLKGFGRTRYLCTVLGPAECGKTHLATALLADWLRAGGRGQWWDVVSLLEAVKEGMGGGGGGGVGAGGGLLARVREGGHLLVLDNVGGQQVTDWTEAVVAHLVRYRQGRRLATVLTAHAEDLVELDRREPRLAWRCGQEVVVRLRLRGVRGVGGA